MLPFGSVFFHVGFGGPNIFSPRETAVAALFSLLKLRSFLFETAQPKFRRSPMLGGQS